MPFRRQLDRQNSLTVMVGNTDRAVYNNLEGSI